MNTITITITIDHPKAEKPKYKFGDKVAVAGDYSPSLWPTGKVVGLLLEDALIPQWFYVVQYDSPSGYTEEYPDDDLVPESFVPTLQAEWDIGDAAWIQAHKEPEAVLDCDRCEGTGYVVDSYTFQSDACSRCAGTGIKDYAKRLPSASLRSAKF